MGASSDENPNRPERFVVERFAVRPTPTSANATRRRPMIRSRGVERRVRGAVEFERVSRVEWR
jgi:hypothetical protein